MMFIRPSARALLLAALALVAGACGPVGDGDDPVDVLDVSPECQQLADDALADAHFDVKPTSLVALCGPNHQACMVVDAFGIPRLIFGVGAANGQVIKHEMMHVLLWCETGDADGGHSSNYWPHDDLT
jgi:hypothetical protein